METIKMLNGTERQAVQVVREIDESKMKDCRKIGARKNQERANRLYENMWHHFDLAFSPEEMPEAAKENKHGSCVSDYAITKDALIEFYKHPFNKAAVESLKKNIGAFSWGMFILNMEPMIVNDDLTYCECWEGTLE